VETTTLTPTKFLVPDVIPDSGVVHSATGAERVSEIQEELPSKNEGQAAEMVNSSLAFVRNVGSDPQYGSARNGASQPTASRTCPRSWRCSHLDYALLIAREQRQ
jgi:hypothetical protein